MCRLTLRMVRSTLVTAWFFADWPTSTSPFLAKATIEGVVREPSELAMTVGSPPSRTATTELVVPRSMPTARAMVLSSCVSSSPAMVLDLHVRPHLERGPGKFYPAFVRLVKPDLSRLRSTFVPSLTSRFGFLFPGSPTDRSTSRCDAAHQVIHLGCPSAGRVEQPRVTIVGAR